MYKLTLLLTLLTSSLLAQYYPLDSISCPGYTNFNMDYQSKIDLQGKSRQESPWGFQEIYIGNAIHHTVSSVQDYLNLVNNNTTGWEWSDTNTHIVHFSSGTYILPTVSTYYLFKVPSRTIIQGAGIGITIFKAVNNLSSPIALFNMENAEDIVLRDFSFYNETIDNKWSITKANDWAGGVRENFLFENIEFDDAFGSIGVSQPGGTKYNFVTFRGLRKRIGNTTARINQNYTTPVPVTYQFSNMNSAGIKLSGQLGIRHGNSVVFHDCILGDNISATLDIYNNYVEIVETSFIDPLHDHSIKSPNGNHIYIHDCDFELTYTEKIINNSYYNPTFYTHEGGGLPNYHFKNITFTRNGLISNNGTVLIESEPFTLYDNRPNNVSGDMVWEGISFVGYTPQHQVVGFPNVQTTQGYEAINYTTHTSSIAQLKNLQQPNFTLNIDNRIGSSIIDNKGVYSWGGNTDGHIDYARDNKTFIGTKANMKTRAYITMQNATVKNIYNSKISGNSSAPTADNVIVSGGTNIGDTLFINYNYSDPFCIGEGNSTIAWSTAVQELQNSTQSYYVITNSDCGTSIGAWVHPINSNGDTPTFAIPASNNFIQVGGTITSVQSVVTCGGYTWIDGNTYTMNNNSATYTLTNVNGCDSIVTLDLTVQNLDLSINITGDVVTSNEVGANYQWLLCGNLYTPLANQNNQSYTAVQNGLYAVEVSKNNCVDTSACVTINSVGIHELNQEQFRAFPNPSNGVFTITINNPNDAIVSIYNNIGQLVFSKTKINSENTPINLKQPKGIYFVEIRNNKHYERTKIIIE